MFYNNKLNICKKIKIKIKLFDTFVDNIED